tara:strand:- start:249 stop:701 length:453 start_codon:yes stop_codon:yes gene_type:complete
MAIDIAEGKIIGKNTCSRLLIAGTMNPSLDLLWTIPYNGMYNGGNGCVMHIRWMMNHWNSGNWYKINDGYYCILGTNTTYQRIGLREVAGQTGSGWSNGHLDITISATGGGTGHAQKMLIQYDADGAPAYGASYILDITYTGALGPVTIS